jgi:hypothetical protein
MGKRTIHAPGKQNGSRTENVARSDQCIKLVSRSLSRFERISELLMEIGRECPRFDSYQRIFQDSTRVQNALCSYYARIVRICADLYVDMQKPGKYSPHSEFEIASDSYQNRCGENYTRIQCRYSLRGLSLNKMRFGTWHAMSQKRYSSQTCKANMTSGKANENSLQ